MSNIPREYDPPWETAECCVECKLWFQPEGRENVCPECAEWEETQVPEVEDA